MGSFEDWALSGLNDDSVYGETLFGLPLSTLLAGRGPGYDPVAAQQADNALRTRQELIPLRDPWKASYSYHPSGQPPLLWDPSCPGSGSHNIENNNDDDSNKAATSRTVPVWHCDHVKDAKVASDDNHNHDKDELCDCKQSSRGHSPGHGDKHSNGQCLRHGKGSSSGRTKDGNE